MMILERDKTGLFQPMATAEQRARNLTRSIEAGQCDPEAGHREIMRATIVAEKIETAQRAAVQAFNQAFRPAVELLWPVADDLVPDLIALAERCQRTDVAEQFRQAWAV